MDDDAKIISDWMAERKASGERGLAQFLAIAVCDELPRSSDTADVVAKVRARCGWASAARIHVMILKTRALS